MKKIMCLLLAAGMINSAAGVLAQSTASVELNASQYHLSGTIEEAKFNQLVFFSVKDSDGNIVHFDGITTGNDGSFDYYFTMPDNAATGRYTFSLSGYDSEQPIIAQMGEEKEITYINPEDVDAALDALDAECAKADGNVSAVIDANKENLRIAFNDYFHYYDELSQDDKSALGEDIKNSAPYNKDIDKFDEVFYKSLAIRALISSTENNVKQVVEDFADYYLLDQTATYELYQQLSEYEAEILKDFTADLTGYDDLEEAFNCSVILNGIYRVNTWGEVVEIFNDYSDEIPFSFTSSEINKASKKIVGNKYDDMDDLESAFKNALDTGSNNGGGGGGGSSRPSSSSGNDSGGIYIGPPKTEISSDDNKHEQDEPSTPAFDDIDEAGWAKDAIIYLNEKNIMSGYDGKVYPNKEITREEFVRLVLDAFGLFEENKTANFDDIDENDWSYKYVACAADKGIISGVGDNLFGKGMNITRQDMAVIIMNAMKLSDMIDEDSSDTELDFTDGSDIADYAVQSVGYMSSHGILNGFEDGSFRPLDNATRAQAAYILYVILNA